MNTDAAIRPHAVVNRGRIRLHNPEYTRPVNIFFVSF